MARRRDRVMMPQAMISFREPFSEEFNDNNETINSNILELQDNISSSLQHLESAMCDLRDAIEQGSMKEADNYLHSMKTNLDYAGAMLGDYLTMDDIYNDVKQLQQQRIIETLKQ